MKKEIIIIGFLVLLITACTTAKNKTGESSNADNCFDWIDNDNDGDYDLDDTDCFIYSEEDWDNDGYLNVDEYEAGTDLKDSNSYP